MQLKLKPRTYIYTFYAPPHWFKQEDENPSHKPIFEEHKDYSMPIQDIYSG